MKLLRVFMVLSFLLLVTCSALAQKVNVNWNKGTTFTGYKTYTWAKGTPAVNPLMGDRIVQEIDTQLTAKGLQKVDASANPDLVVIYHAGRDTETRINTMDTGIYGPCLLYTSPSPRDS